MSQQNVDLVKRAIEAFDRRDIDSLALLITADFEWSGALLGYVEGGSYKGRAGMERYFADASETWEGFRSLTEEFRDLPGQVLVFGRLEARGKVSGVSVDASFAMVVDVRDGRASRVRAYLDRGEALRAAGLFE